MVKFESRLSEDEVRSMFECIQSEPVRHSGSQCKVVTTMHILGDPETRHHRNKVTLTWSKGTGNIAIRTAAIIEDAALQYMACLDTSYRALLDEKEPETLEGMEEAIESLRLPAEHSYEGVPGQSDSDSWSVVTTKLPDTQEFVQAIENLCEWGNQELADFEPQRVKFIKMMVREFKASRDYLLATVDEGMEAAETEQDPGAAAVAAPSSPPVPFSSARRSSPVGS